MPTFTSFLSLTLPEFNEFLDSWNEPVNQNMQELDAFLQDLFNSLVLTSSTSTWAALRGSLGSLASRLDVSINADGTIDLSASPEVLGLASSSTHGTEASPDDDPRGRFDRSDFEVYDARQSFVGGRFVPIGSTGPSAGFPEEELDAGIAARFADYGAKPAADGVGPISSPQRPAVSGLLVGGGATFMTAPGGIGRLRFDGSSAPAVFNIDGYLFRVREQIDFDYTALSPTDDNYVWLYIERVEGNYGDANFLYNQDAGYALKDLRILENGTAGATSTSTFTDAAALFQTAVLGKVREGDILVLDTTSAAGKYVIDSVDSDIQVTIRGEFKANVTGATWHVQDNHHPNIGAVETGADPEIQPAYQAGRVYIGRVRHKTASDPTDVVNLAKGGVYDSGWISVTAAGIASTPIERTHNLGVPPTDVQIFVRSAANAPTYEPVVERRIMTDIDPANLPDPVVGDFKFHTQLVPSIRWHSTTVAITVRLKNAQTNNISTVPEALFTDSAGADQPTGELRIICKR